MFKVSIRHFLICFTCIAGFIMGAQTLAPVAHAAGGTITLTMPNNAALLGHVGTQIKIAGTGLTPATTYSLFTTTNNDPAACSAQNAAQMAPFTSNPTIATNVTGAFQLTTTWPDNAATATTPYFVCAVLPNGLLTTPAGTLSTQSFTVAQPVTLAVSSPTVQPGGTITVSGTGWVPPQDISVSIIGNNGSIANQTVQGNQVTATQGSFSVTFTLSANTAPGSYTVKAFAVNEQTPAMSATVQNAFTVAQPQATATPTQQATATPTQQTTPNPVTHPTGNGGGGMNILIFGLGGLGAVFVIIGITVYVIYSRKGQPVY